MAGPTIIAAMIAKEFVHLVTRNAYRVIIARVMADFALLFTGLGGGRVFRSWRGRRCIPERPLVIPVG